MVEATDRVGFKPVFVPDIVNMYMYFKSSKLLLC